MLYLRQSADFSGDVSAQRVPIAELTALGLERALLAPDCELRERELRLALGRDPAVSEWALQAAQRGLRRSDATIEEAMPWLAECLALELESHLSGPDQSAAGAGTDAANVEYRLPVLVRRLAQYERQLARFGSRLEHEKLEAMKELAYGASHEINNPLANIAARGQTLLQDEADPERRRKLAAIHRQAMRAHEMISDLMLFARPPKLEPAAFELRALVGKVVEKFGEDARVQNTDLVYESGEQPVELIADPTQISVAVHALVSNALEAVGHEGHIQVAVHKIQRGDLPFAEIAVRDDGPGISDEIRPHIFDPFFSGREAGRGLGFGLSKCWRIVSDHGGEVLANRPASGAEFLIRLPAPERATSAE